MKAKSGAKGRPKKSKAGESAAQRAPRQQPQGKDMLFVLDIGTRSVIGVVGVVVDDILKVLCVESAEHSGRAVVDGQIEDIQQTARVAGVVKSRMEKALGVALKEVHVAAAGRVLKTEHVVCTMELDEQRSIDAKETAALESLAVQTAYERLIQGLDTEDPADFCCVGNTVAGYRLDGYSFSTLVGHKGREAGIDLIATFLPTEVVESLYTTMSMLGLTIASMTLEPIAAMNAVVPQELRLLNIALVDVGAGTSDIAVANEGSVRGYTMATVAGDEITEQVMQEFLVDFSTAEQMKFDASAGKETIEYADVLGFPYTVALPELLERIQPAIRDLAEKIAQGILSINDVAPKAVFMVGGGSRTPGLCALVAQALGVEENKVAIGGNNYMKRQIEADTQYLSAEYATPIGIAVTAMTAGSGESFAVFLNGTRLQLLGQTMTVMEALRRGGYQYGQIMGCSGKSVVFELNGVRRIARGGLPTLAEVRVNGAVAGLSTVLRAGDEISFVPAEDGVDAAPLVRDQTAYWAPFEVELFGQTVPAGSQAAVNGIPAEGGQLIRQMDQVTVWQIDTLGDLLEAQGFPNQEEGIWVNGQPCEGLEQPLKPGDYIDLTPETRPQTNAALPAETVDSIPVPPDPDPAPARQEPAVEETPSAPAHRTEIPGVWTAPVPPRGTEPPAVPGEAAPQPAPATQESPAQPMLHILLNGEVQELPAGKYQFFHLLNYVDIDPNEPKGDVVLRRNGISASYLDPIHEGDRIEISWSSQIDSTF